MNTWNIIKDLGSIAGLIVLLFTIFQNVREKPKFKFDFSGRRGEPSIENDIEYYTYTFNGTLKNQSLSTNSICKIFLVVWKNQKKNETLRFGYGNSEIENKTNSEKLKLPIIFRPREAIDIEIIFKFHVKNTPDEKLLSEFIPVQTGSQFLIAKHEYELAFEDVNENLYDEKGKLCNREEISLRWTLPNAEKKSSKSFVSPLQEHKLKILKSNVKFKFKLLLSIFGLWK